MSDPKLDGLSEEERLAAEWAALADEGSDGGGVADMAGDPSNRVLNQDEIDSLLGFDSDGAGDGDNPASRRSSTARWSPTNVCRCWRSCSTAWCA